MRTANERSVLDASARGYLSCPDQATLPCADLLLFTPLFGPVCYISLFSLIHLIKGVIIHVKKGNYSGEKGFPTTDKTE